MTSLETADLVASVSLAVARTLGDPLDVPALRDPRLAGQAVAEEVVTASAYHGILPMLWDASVRVDGVPEALRETARHFYLPLVARDLRLVNLLWTVDTALTGAGVPYAVYKGPAVARLSPRPALRMFSDLDVLISRSDVDRADAALRSADLTGGWHAVPDGYAETMYSQGPSGVVDVHWHVMREAQVRSAFSLDTASMLARARRVPLYDGSAVVLDDVDLLIAVATHACFDGAYRLGWLVDVAQILRAPSFSIEELRRRCAQTKASLPVQVVLDRAVRALEVPAAALPLDSGTWRKMLSRLSAARPVERTFRQAGRGGLVFRATRATSGRSAAALGRLVISEALVPLVHDRAHRWRTVRDQRI